jgi:tetratricopeptide (TPR) repeat protein
MEKQFHLEKEALLASGIKKGNGLAGYGKKLSFLYEQFIQQVLPPPHPTGRARDLFYWLWKERPTRYRPHSNFRLNHAVDAQLSKKNQTVGNCLGLTLLYNCLLRRIGIHAEALYLENAFGSSPHVLTLLQSEESTIDIENILPHGFDFKVHLNDPSRIRWGDKELVADVYHSLGNEYFENGELAKALNNYETAIKLNPQYEKAHLNKAILMDKLGTRKEDRTIKQ